MNMLQTSKEPRLFWYLSFHCQFCNNLSGDAVKNLEKLVWISLLNTFSTGDQSLVLILSKRTVLVRKCLENSNFLLNAGTGHSGVVSTVMGLCPLLWAVFCPLPGLPWLRTLSNGFSACILGLHTTFSQIKKMLFLANRPNTNHPGLPSFSSRGLLKPGGFIECI